MIGSENDFVIFCNLFQVQTFNSQNVTEKV